MIVSKQCKLVALRMKYKINECSKQRHLLKTSYHKIFLKVENT